MTAVGEAELGPGDRIGTGLILRGSWARVRRAARPLAALWLIAGPILGGLEAGLLALGFDTSSLRFSTGALAYNVMLAVLTGVLSAIGLRLLLGSPGSWRDLDGAFVEAGSLLAAFTLAFGLWMLALDEMFARPAAPFLGIVVGVSAIVLVYVTVKLVLWPVGRLMGRPEVTVRRSWRLMRRATRGYILAHLVFLAPMLGLLLVVTPTGGTLPPLGEGALEAVFVGFSILSLAATATLYDLRVARPASLADVFA